MQWREEVDQRKKVRAVNEITKDANGTVGIANESKSPIQSSHGQAGAIWVNDLLISNIKLVCETRTNDCEC